MVAMSAGPALHPAPAFYRGLISIAELNAWERAHIPVLKTSSGRDLYFAIARYFFQLPDAANLPLKSFTLNMTDRAMRLRIREFAALGLLVIHTHHADTRSRSITPTAKLYDLFEQHSAATAMIFNKRFHHLHRED
jgi:hypothetical protein